MINYGTPCFHCADPWTSIEYNSDKRSWLWIGPCHCFPKRSTPNDLPHLVIYRRSGLQWLETSPIQCQWTHSHTIQTCGHACVLVLVIVSPNRLPQMTASFGRLSKEWTPTLCDVIVVWPWLQCQRKFVSTATHSVLTDAIIWQETLELVEIKLQ